MIKAEDKILIDIYIPILLKFKDDKIIFKEEDLENINHNIYKNFDKAEIAGDKFLSKVYKHSEKDKEIVFEKNDGLKNHFEHIFTDQELNLFVEKLMNLTNYKIKEIDVFSPEFYYYHHRVIIRYRFRIDSTCKHIRMIREAIKDNYQDIMNKYIVKSINDLVVTDNKIQMKDTYIRQDAKVIMYYSYMLLFIPKNKYNINRISDRLQTLSFEIIESSKGYFKYGYEHFVRISIPSTIVYFDKSISVELKTDFINSVYQYCLYSKKLEDIKNEVYLDIDCFMIENLDRYNKLDETQLTSFWSYAINTLGGNISDNQIHEISKHNFYFAIMAFIISMMSFLLSILDRF